MAEQFATSDWEVFARNDLRAPLRHVGTVAAERAEDAEVFAFKLYDEWSWKEMIVIPRADVVRLIPHGDEGPSVDGGRVLVFGRSDSGPLLFQGEIELPAHGGMDAVFGRFGDGWVELSFSRAAAVRWVLGPASKVGVS